MKRKQRFPPVIAIYCNKCQFIEYFQCTLSANWREISVERRMKGFPIAELISISGSPAGQVSQCCRYQPRGSQPINGKMSELCWSWLAAFCLEFFSAAVSVWSEVVWVTFLWLNDTNYTISTTHGSQATGNRGIDRLLSLFIYYSSIYLMIYLSLERNKTSDLLNKCHGCTWTNKIRWSAPLPCTSYGRFELFYITVFNGFKW